MNGPSFETMLVWWLTDDWGPLTEWVIRYHKESGRFIDQEKCLAYVSALITDFEIRAEKFAEEEGKTLGEMYKIMKEEYQQLNKEKEND